MCKGKRLRDKRRQEPPSRPMQDQMFRWATEADPETGRHRPRGVRVLPAKTGDGKSHAILGLVPRLLKDAPDVPRIVVMAPYNNVLPQDDEDLLPHFERVFGDEAQAVMDRDVLILKSKANTCLGCDFDAIERSCPDVGERFKGYEALKSSSLQLRHAEAQNSPWAREAAKSHRRDIEGTDSTPGLYGRLLDEVREAFQRELAELEAQAEEEAGDDGPLGLSCGYPFRNKADLPYVLRLLGRKDWEWLPSLFPGVVLDFRKAVFCNVHKASFSVPRLYNTPVKILESSEYSSGGVYVLDEADAAKDAFNSIIIENASRNLVDMLQVIETVWRWSNSGAHYSADIRKVLWSPLPGRCDEDPDDGGPKTIGDYARAYVHDKIKEENRLHHILKATKRDSSDQRSIDFLFQAQSNTDFSDHASLRIRYDPKERMNVVFKCRSKKAKKGYWRLSEFADSCAYLMSKIRRLVAYMAIAYATQVRSAPRTDAPLYVRAILDSMGVKDPKQVESLVYGVSRLLTFTAKEEFGAEEKDFYESGFSVVTFTDSLDHDTRSVMAQYRTSGSAESQVEELARHALVIVVSATIEFESVLSNFNWDHVRDTFDADNAAAAQEDDTPPPLEVRGLDPDIDERLRKASAAMVADRTPAEVEVVEPWFSSVQSPAMIAQAWRSHDATQGRALESLFCSEACPCDAYAQENYMVAYQVFLRFCQEADVRSMLMFATAGAKEGSQNWDQGTLGSLFDLARSQAGLGPGDARLEILENVADYRRDFDGIKARLTAGEKILCLSPYATMAKGVNARYAPPANQKVHRVHGLFDSDCRWKDWDGVALMMPTCVAPLTAPLDTSHGLARRLEGIMGDIVGLFELREVRDLPTKDAFMTAVSDAFMAKNRARRTPVTSMLHTRMAIASIIAQAEGRIRRTDLQGEKTLILLDPRIADPVKGMELGPTPTEHLSGDFLETVHQVANFRERRGDLAHRPEAENMEFLNARCAECVDFLVRRVNSGHATEEEERAWRATRRAPFAHPWGARRPTEDEMSALGFDDLGLYLPWDTLYAAVPRGVPDYCYLPEPGHEDSLDEVRVLLGADAATAGTSWRSASASDARLPEVATIPGVSEAFKRDLGCDLGRLTACDNANHMLVPVAYNNLFLAAIGEEGGSHILGAHSLPCEEIRDPRLLEKMDYLISGTRVFVDFKHARGRYAPKDSYSDHVFEKMAAIGCTRAVVANLLRPDGMDDLRPFERDVRDQGQLLVVPWLWDPVRRLYNDEAIARIHDLCLEDRKEDR